MLSTSDVVDDVAFLYNGANGSESKKTRMSRPVLHFGIESEVCRLRLHLVLTKMSPTKNGSNV